MQITITLDARELESLFGCVCTMSDRLAYLEKTGKRRPMPQDAELDELIEKLHAYRIKG